MLFNMKKMDVVILHENAFTPHLYAGGKHGCGF